MTAAIPTRPDTLPFAGGRLRTLVRSDLPRLRVLADDYGVARQVGGIPHPYRAADAEAYLGLYEDGWTTGRKLNFAIEADGTGLIGVCGLFLRSDEPDLSVRFRELGYWIGRPFWGRGLTFAACQALIAWGVSVLPLDRLDARVLIDNRASMGLIRKLGFRQTDARTRDRHPVRMSEVETVYFEMPLGDGGTAS